jgi:hypothetical protein
MPPIMAACSFLEGLMSRFIRARMAGWLLVSLALTVAVAATAPTQLPVSLYKLSLITSAAWVAYWIDRSLFPYARPDAFLIQPEKPATPEMQLAFGLAQLRRAIIIGAAMVGVALGA